MQVDQDYWRAGTLVEVLRRSAQETPDKIVYTYLRDGENDAQNLTCAELEQRARAIARALRLLCQQGELVILLYPDGLDFIIGLFGCFYAGMVGVSGVQPFAQRSVPRFLNIVRDCAPTVVLGTSTVLTEFQGALDANVDKLPLKWMATDVVSMGGATDAPTSCITNDSIALLQYTSGSTGTPRGVMLSHRNLLHNLTNQAKAFGYRQNDLGVSWLPCSHDMGLIGGVLMALYWGGRCILMSPFHLMEKPVRWLRAISKYRAAVSGGPNFAYDLCVRRITAEQKAGLDLSKWRIAFNGAETVRSQTLERFAASFRECGFDAKAMYPCYGIAEATLFVAGGAKSALPKTITVSREALSENRVIMLPSVQEMGHVVRLVACGRSLPDQHIAIVRPTERILCVSTEVGEIWISGPSVARGYFNREEETNEQFRAYLATGMGPYLRSGDLGFMLDGELFVTGRLKDLVIIRGLNYYPQDFEAAAERSHPAIRRGCSAAFSVDNGTEECLVVVCELSNGEEERAGEVISAIRRAIFVEYELRTHTVVLVPAGTIPKTPSGKIQRSLCREEYTRGHLTVVHDSRADGGGVREHPPVSIGYASAGESQRLEEVQRWFYKKLSDFGIDPTRLRPDMHLAEIGVDSLRIVELKSEIENQFGISIQAADVFNQPSLSELADYIAKRCTNAASTPVADTNLLIPLPAESNFAGGNVKDGKGRLRQQRLSRIRPHHEVKA